MKLLLISIHPYRSPQSVPLAPAFLKGALLADTGLSRAITAEIAEFLVQEEAVCCAETILAQKPDAVAFSVYVWNREQAASIAALLKASSPSLLIFAGGAEPTANPLPLLSLGCFDALFRGEGELSFPEALRRLLQGLPLSGLPGLLLPGDLTVGALSPLPDLDRLPSPYLDGLLDPAGPGGGTLADLPGV